MHAATATRNAMHQQCPCMPASLQQAQHWPGLHLGGTCPWRWSRLAVACPPAGFEHASATNPPGSWQAKSKRRPHHLRDGTPPPHRKDPCKSGPPRGEPPGGGRVAAGWRPGGGRVATPALDGVAHVRTCKHGLVAAHGFPVVLRGEVAFDEIVGGEVRGGAQQPCPPAGHTRPRD